ncbi:hypothetical protein EDC39_1281 [Geothermobacter ehrlichii]|uniref:Uncharacterized protein n=1 Tax=Geothermobacter ehrlichii TaxID=213224 RepID=A0A5D3WG87_9BACT|nr:hypothetical protein EDC39_1281 [Geothermobacter ehrlichii]
MGGPPTFVVVDLGIKDTRVALVIDQVVDGVLKSAGEDLVLKGSRQKNGLIVSVLDETGREEKGSCLTN